MRSEGASEMSALAEAIRIGRKPIAGRSLSP